MLNAIRRFAGKVLGLFGLGVASAHAAVPAAVTTAISDAQADLETVMTGLIVMAAVVYALRWVYARFV